MPNRDPSRTTILRRKFEIDLRKRLKKISRAIKSFIVTEDEFGLKEPKPVSLLQRTYQFRTSSQKLKVFQQWLQQQIDDGLLAVRIGRNWSDVYVESAYKKGLERAYIDTHRKEFATQPVDYYIGGREQFLQATFWAPETIEKIQLLSTRTFEELKGISGAMSQQINRILAEGITNGYGPEKIARNMDNAIKKIDRTRARVIARTEVIHAHAEGQLDGFKKLGIDEVSAEVEWLTAGDPKVCEQCAAMEGNRYKVDEAHGLIPLHPNCLSGDTLISPRGDITGVSKRWYDGDMIVIKTSAGDILTCTPNHPILSTRGFVPADTLDIGCEVVHNIICERETFTNCNNINKPSRIEDIVKTFLNSPKMTTVPVPVSAIDFHGDGIGSKVAIIGANSELRNSFNLSKFKQIRQQNFIRRHMIKILLICKSSLVFFVKRNNPAFCCLMCGRYLSSPFSNTHLGPFQRLSLGLATDVNTSIKKSVSYNSASNFKLFSNSIFRHSFFIKLANLIDRRRSSKLAKKLLRTAINFCYIKHKSIFHYSGYVYNIETTESYYISNNLSSKNCRCAWMPVV